MVGGLVHSCEVRVLVFDAGWEVTKGSRMLTSLRARRWMGVETLILRACLMTATGSCASWWWERAACVDDADACEDGRTGGDRDAVDADDDDEEGCFVLRVRL